MILRKGTKIENNSVNRGKVNEEKTRESIVRAKSKIFDYGYCNEWQYFITLTIDGKKYDRTDLKKYYKDFSQWLRDYNKKHGIDIKYIFIPELHSDGLNWHMHGLIMGLPLEHLRPFTTADSVPRTLVEQCYKNWDSYANKFGFVSLDVIKNREKVSGYITKYISKGLSNSVRELNAKMYYCSKGLKTATEIKRGLLKYELSNPDWQNDYVAVKWLYDTTKEEVSEFYFADNDIVSSTAKKIKY